MAVVNTSAPSLLQNQAPGVRIASAKRVFSIVEVQKQNGQLVETSNRFDWDASSRSAPRGSVSFPMRQRIKRVDYPEGKEPTMQMLGFVFDNATINGVWDDRYAGRNFAMGQWQRFEALMQRGTLVRVSFEDIRLFAAVERFEPTYFHRARIGYEIELAPIRREVTATVITSSLETAPQHRETPQTHNDRARKNVVAMRTLNLGMNPLRTASNFMNEIANDVAGLFAYVEEIQGVLDQQFFSPATNTVQTFARLAHSFRIMQNTGLELLRKLGTLKAQTFLAVKTAASVLDFERWVRGMRLYAHLLILDAGRAALQMDRQVAAPAKAVYRPRAGESLYAVSTKFYNTPHNWRAIAERNNLQTFELQGHEFLIIPNLPGGPATSRPR